MKEIKVNLPFSEEDYKIGAGEGCFVIVDDDTFKDYEANKTGGKYPGILHNNSLVYPRFVNGARVMIELRGENRPVVPYDYLIDPNTKIDVFDFDAARIPDDAVIFFPFTFND